MFARRSSSSTKSIALLTACLFCCVSLNLIENVASMSLERLAIERQNESQMDYSETMALTPEELNESNSVANSDMMSSDVSDDSSSSTISVVPVKEGQSDVYLLVPAGGSQNQNTEDVLQSLAENDMDDSEGLSDMMMLESEDTPAIEIIKVPQNMMEQKLKDDFQNIVRNENATKVSSSKERGGTTNSDYVQLLEKMEEMKSNQAEMEFHPEELESATEPMVNMLVETVEEIKTELENELLGVEEQEESKSEDNDSQLNKDQEKAISAELPLEHKDVVSIESKLSASKEISENLNSEEKIISAVMEQEYTESPIETDNSKVEPNDSSRLGDSEKSLNDATAEEHEITTEIVEFPIIIEDMSEISSDSEANGSEQIQYMHPMEKFEKKEEPSYQQIEEDQQMIAGHMAQVAVVNGDLNESSAMADNSALEAEAEASADVEDLNPAMDSSEPENDDKTAEEMSLSGTVEAEVETQNKGDIYDASSNNLNTVEELSNIYSLPVVEEEEESSTSKAAEKLVLVDEEEVSTQDAGDLSEDIRVTESPNQSEEPSDAEEVQSENTTKINAILEQFNTMLNPEIPQPMAERFEMHETTKKESEEQSSADQSKVSEDSPILAVPESLEVSQTTDEYDFVTEGSTSVESQTVPQIVAAEVQDQLKPAEESQSIEQSQSVDSLQPGQVETQGIKQLQAIENVKSEDDVQSYEDVKHSEEEHVENEQFADDSESFTDVKPSYESEHTEYVQPVEELHSYGLQPQPAVEPKPSKVKEAEQINSVADQQSFEDAHIPEVVHVEHNQPADEYQHSDDMQSLQDAKPSNEDAQSIENHQTVESPEPAEISQAAEESDTVEETLPIQVESQNAGDVVSDKNSKPVEQTFAVDDGQNIKESQSLLTSQNVENIQNVAAAQQQQSQGYYQATEDSYPPLEESGNADISASMNEAHTAEELALTLQEDASEASDSLPMFDAIEVAKQETSSAQIELLEPMPVIADAAESLSTSLANEESLQNIETAEESQQIETSEQSSVDNKDDPIINNAGIILVNQVHAQQSDRPQDSSMLTTILQVPPPPPMSYAEMQQQLIQEWPLVTTGKPLNVMDSILNYVNASFMSQPPQQEVVEKDDVPFSSQLRRYDGAQVWRIVVQNDRERKLADELQTKYDGQLWKEVKQEVDYLLKPQVLADAERYVRAANLSRIVLIDNLQKVIEVENPPAEEITQLQNRKGHRLTWQAYHRLDDIHGFFDYMAKTYPDICSVEIIGYSIEKRPLKLLKISNGNANNPGIWIDGGMHAREWIGVAVVTYIANQVVEGWDDLPSYMRNVNWYIHAVANPDGYEYSQTTDRLWRKNMRSHGRACPGVDLNRNFGYKWGGKGTSANPCSQTYRGSKAFSEPETFYISKFISNFPRDTFKGFLSFHSYGQYILYPWGYDYHITKDMADLDLVARQAGTSITRNSGIKYTVGSAAHTLYPAAGGSDDWAKGFAEIKYSYTIEMGDTGRYGFILPATHIEPNGRNGLIFVQTVARAITMGKNSRRRKIG